MQQSSSSELFVVCTDRIVIECRCGGALILLGREEDWYEEGRTAFACHECGGRLTLANQFNEEQGPALIGGGEAESMSVRDLIRALRTAEVGDNNPPVARRKPGSWP